LLVACSLGPTLFVCYYAINDVHFLPQKIKIKNKTLYIHFNLFGSLRVTKSIFVKMLISNAFELGQDQNLFFITTLNHLDMTNIKTDMSVSNLQHNKSQQNFDHLRNNKIFFIYHGYSTHLNILNSCLDVHKPK